MRILFVIAVVGLAACSSQPRTTAELQSPASVPSEAVNPVKAGAASGNGVAQNEPSAFEPPPGYKPRTLDGQRVYCRKMVLTGSRFDKELCMTQEQLAEHERSNQAMRDDINQHTPICGAFGCD